MKKNEEYSTQERREKQAREKNSGGIKTFSEKNLREDWLNDALKGFLVEHKRRVLFDWSHLKVLIPDADYLLAMKCLASRVDSQDKTDIIFLIEKLILTTTEEVFQIIETYYPRSRIKPATQFFIEEIFEEWKDE